MVIINVSDLTYIRASGNKSFETDGSAGSSVVVEIGPSTILIAPYLLITTHTYFFPIAGLTIKGELPPAYSTKIVPFAQKLPSIIFTVIFGTSWAETFNKCIWEFNLFKSSPRGGLFISITPYLKFFI